MIGGSTYSHEFGYERNIDIKSFSSRLTCPQGHLEHKSWKQKCGDKTRKKE